MANYIIIGGDGKEYGPVTDADVRLWIAEGRLNALSQAKAESDAEFRALAQFPEFAVAFASPVTPETIMPLKATADFSARDYELDLGGCIARGFGLLKTNGGLLIGGVLVYGLIQLAFSLFGKLPFIGVVFSLANFVVSGALMGGLFYLILRLIRGEPASLNDLFAGFRRSFGQLFLGVLVPGLLIGLTLLPFVIYFCLRLVPLVKGVNIQGMSQSDAVNFVQNIIATAVLPSLWVLLICGIPATYLSVSWKFTLPLIIDQQLDFGAAMKASWRKVNQHWWQVFGLVLLIDLVNLAGLCVCCVGLIVSIPIGLAALMYGYETIFRPEKS
jgi:hypothetical protein